MSSQMGNNSRNVGGQVSVLYLSCYLHLKYVTLKYPYVTQFKIELYTSIRMFSITRSIIIIDEDSTDVHNTTIIQIT